MPGTALAVEAAQFVRSITPLWLLNHLFRTFAFAELLGRKGGMRYDSEILFLGCIMHDLGLAEEFAGKERFELDGADAASKFLFRRGVSRGRVNLVWRSIAFHTSPGLYDRMPSEVALVGRGVLADVTGIRIELLPRNRVRDVLATWPRYGFRDAFPKLIAKVIGRKPQTATGSFFADVLRARGIAVQSVTEAMAFAPFEEA